MLVLVGHATKLDLMTTGAGVGAVGVFGVADGSGTVRGLETNHTLNLGNVVSSLPSFLFFNVMHTLTHLGAATNDTIELFAKKAPTNPDHGDTDSRDVANAHKEEENRLLTTVGGANVDGDETSDCHGRDADEEAVDEFDVILTVTGVKDGGSNERGKGEDEDMDTEEVEVLAAPSCHRLQLGADCGSPRTLGYAFEHVDDGRLSTLVCVQSRMARFQMR